MARQGMATGWILRRGPVPLCLGALLLSGCAYFNGMYNANRYQAQAEASERAGRLGEARERWQQAALHAESLTARHPNSRWVEDALLVRGRAVVHLERWSEAVTVLEAAVQRANNADQRSEARELLGRANLAMNRLTEAREALDSAVASERPATRAAALLDRGRLWLALQQPESAAADFRQSAHPHARYDLARALLLLGDTTAGALYDSLVTAGPYAEADWRPALDSLAAAGSSAHASELVDRLVARRDVTAGQSGRLLLDDAMRRLARLDTAGAAGRLDLAEAASRDSAEASIAAVRRVRLAIAAAASDSDLAAQRERLQVLAQQGGEAARDAQSLLRQLGQVDRLAEAPTTPDAFWFLRAEVLRDTLHAARLAAEEYAQMASRFPDSPWTPKALVAAIAAGHPAGDSLRGLLLERYARSPYAIAVAGGSGADTAYTVLEDSLRRALARGTDVRGAPGRGEPTDADEEPGVRRGRAPARPATSPRPVAPSPRPDTGPPRPVEPGR